MKQQKIKLDDAWLNINVQDDEIFNPMKFVFSGDTEHESIIEKISWLLMQPEYFAFTCKQILNVEIAPFQLVLLQEIWDKKFPMLIGSRGMSKSFTLAVYCILRCLLMPRRKIIVVGAAFRQSKVIFEYMETIWKNAPVLRDLCDNNSGPSRDIDRCVLRINQGAVTCLPLGNGEKIRGQRANDIIADEFASIPRDIFENVVAGFASVSASPIEKVKMKAKQKLAKSLGEPIEDQEKNLIHKSNQIILAGTAYYDFNHFAEYWKKYKQIIETRGNPKRLEEIFGDTMGADFDWRDYCVFRIPANYLPEGFMDDAQISRAKATVHSGIFQMEYGSVFTSDSQGFFKRSLIESCVVSENKPVKLPGGEVFFEPMLYGDGNKQYIFGVDPASEVDNFSIIVIELNNDHRRIVYCWTTTRQEHKERVKTGLADEDDFYSYCARKIRNLMKIFPCREIAMDSQGGGIAVMEALHDKDKIREGELAIWPTIDPDKEKDTDDKPGLHILQMCNFAKADWLAEANHGMRKDMEDKVLLFPMFDAVSVGLSAERDKIENRIYDTLEDCVMEIESLKDELSMIVITQTGAGRERWDTPDVKTSAGRKSRLRKDRYSALLMANMSARQKPQENIMKDYLCVGGFAQSSGNKEESSKDYFIGPNWWTENMEEMY
jgi:hypothetical protein